MGLIELPNEALKIIKQFLEIQQITDYTITASPATCPGENFCGIINRVTINGKNGQKANTQFILIAKIAPSNKIVRLTFPIRAVYEREIYCYTNVFPELIKFQREQKIAAPFIFTPTLYNASLDEFNETLLLEDMLELGYNKHSAFQTLDYEHASYVIKEYGKLHALSFALRRIKPHIYENLKHNTTDQVFQSMPLTEARRASYKAKTDEVLKCVDKEKDTNAYNMFAKFAERMLESVQNCLKPESAGEYAVLTHGDSWINNYLFKYEGSSIAKMCFLDWQMSRWGSPALDLSHFIFCCIGEDIRKEHYVNLLNVYYESLSVCLNQFRLDVKTEFPFSVLESHLKKFSAYGLYMAVFVLTLTMLRGKEVPTFQTSKTESDIFQMTKPRDAQDLEFYRSRMGAIVRDFTSLGFEV